MDPTPETVRAANQTIMMRSERPRDLFGPLLLDRKEHDGDDAGDQDQVPLVRSFEPRDQEHTFHGAEDTDGRGDDAVADEERDADEGQEGDEGHLSARLEERNEEFPEHDGPAFAAACRGSWRARRIRP